MTKERILGIVAILAVALLSSCGGKDQPENKLKGKLSIVGNWIRTENHRSESFWSETSETYSFHIDGTGHWERRYKEGSPERGTVTDMKELASFEWEIMSDKVIQLITKQWTDNHGTFIYNLNLSNFVSFSIQGDQARFNGQIYTRVK